MAELEIKGVRLGKGIPKTIVSLMAADKAGALASLTKGLAAGVDCFELRADFCDQVHNAKEMAALSSALNEALPHNPLVFTFRSAGQGGALELPLDEYVALNREIIAQRAADIVDIEWGIGADCVAELCAMAKAANVTPLVSYHDFSGTPAVEWMLDLLRDMQECGAGICKIATMANCSADALRLLQASEAFTRTSKVPLVSMAMGAAGSITRLTGELFGSCMTFCALESASAPGQVPIHEAKEIKGKLHEYVGC